MRIFRKLAQLLDVDLTSTPPSDGDALTYDSGSSRWVPGAGGGGGGAPTDATYITQTANSDLENEQALSALATGLVKVTNGTGVLSTATGGTDYANASHQHAGEDITSGTVADARIASTIARDSEVTAAISASEAGQVRDGDAAGGVLGGTYPNPSFAADMATQAELDAHVNDTSAAHAASAISFSPTGNLAATDAQAAIAEAATDAASALATHESDTTSVHGITDTSALYLSGGTDVALADGGTGASLTDPNSDRMMFWDDSAGAVTWLAPGTGLSISGTTLNASGGSVAASDVSVADAGGYLTATTVEAALQEILAGVFAQGTYTPTLTASTSNPTLGSGSTAFGRYMRIGNLVVCWGKIGFGSSGANAGSGNYRVSLPVTASINVADIRIGNMILYDSSVGSTSFSDAVPLIADGEETYFYMQRTGSSSFVGSAHPWAWAASDEMSWFIVYPAG